MAQENQCKATTYSGKRCSRTACGDDDYCYQHPDSNPYKLDESTREEFIELLRSGRMITTAAAGVGVARTTVYEAFDRIDGFEDRARAAEREAFGQVEESLLMAALKGNVKAAIEFLARRMKEWRKKDRYQVEHSGGDNAIKIENIDKQEVEKNFESMLSRLSVDQIGDGSSGSNGRAK